MATTNKNIFSQEMGLQEREIILDTETTGLDPLEGDRLIEIACIELVDKVRTGCFFQTYLKPSCEVSRGAFDTHGISTEFLQDKPLFSEKAKEFLDFIQDSTLVIHNAPFDLKFLNYELKMLNIASLRMDRVIDTFVLARKLFPGAKASLDALCTKFKIDLSARIKHGALLDCELLTDVYIELCGGAQTRLDFTVSFEKSKNMINQITPQNSYKPSRNHQISEEELTKHLEFLTKIKNPLWLNQKKFEN